MKKPIDDSPAAAEEGLELILVALLPDDFYRGRSPDGSGFDLIRAPYARDWMDATSNRYAYRCLPLTIANQLGLWITNPIGFTARWNGSLASDGVHFEFDRDRERWSRLISCQFGQGIITWNNPFLIRTRPVGSRLLVTGPANRFKVDAQPLMAAIETDWLVSTFTMNWRILRPHTDVRFEIGEPILQMVPLARNVILDMEKARVVVCREAEQHELVASFREWSRQRDAFHKLVEDGKTKQQWQRDYFLGRDERSNPAETDAHRIKIAALPIAGAEALALGEKYVAVSEKGGAGALPAADGPCISVTKLSDDARIPVVDGDGFLWSVPTPVTALWKGGNDFTLATESDGDSDEVVECDPAAPGLLRVQTGLTVRVSKGARLRVRGARGAGAETWWVREKEVVCSEQPANLWFEIELLRSDVPSRIAGPIARLEVVSEHAPALRVVEASHHEQGRTERSIAGSRALLAQCASNARALCEQMVSRVGLATGQAPNQPLVQGGILNLPLRGKFGLGGNEDLADEH